MKQNIVIKANNGDIIQGYKGQYVIRRFRSIDDMNKAMQLTSNFDKANALVFYKYIKCFTSVYKPVTKQMLLEYI